MLRDMTDALDGSSNQFDLSGDEFERLRVDPDQVDPILWAHPEARPVA